MKPGFIIFLILIVSVVGLTKCSRPKSPGLASQIQPSGQTDSSEVLISTIEIKLKATKEEQQTFTDGILPWINMEETEKEYGRLIDPDEIVLPYQTATLLIDYPLNNSATFEISTAEKGWTRKQLINEISQKYHYVYSEEKKTTAKKILSPEKREGLANRNETDGKYGIWGHDLSDLDLSTIEVYRSNGKIILRLGVES